MTYRSFASDNNAGIHPEILRAIADANDGHVVGYGDDVFTERAITKFKQHLGDDIDVYFVFNGTGANVVALQASTRPHNAIICTNTSHIHFDECGAPERMTGCKLIDVPTPDGKLNVDLIAPHIHGIGDVHHVQARVVSITQSTELGTVYEPDEIRAIANFCHSHDLLLHMDGARICNAAASLNVPLRAITTDVGVDALSFGGTKNGMMGGEAVVFFNNAITNEAKFIRKQSMQLASKMRFISAQFEAMLSNDLWKRNASHANAMAQRLAQKLESAVKITRAVQANAVFAIIPREKIPLLQARSFFYVWDESTSEVRWMCSFDTTKEDVDKFAAFVRSTL
jgi:threonine aldolase